MLAALIRAMVERNGIGVGWRPPWLIDLTAVP
jgi:hypothetical protein